MEGEIQKFNILSSVRQLRKFTSFKSFTIDFNMWMNSEYIICNEPLFTYVELTLEGYRKEDNLVKDANLKTACLLFRLLIPNSNF